MSDLLSPDSFPVSKTDRLYSQHLLLNDYLVEGVRDLERFTPDPKWKKLPKRQSIDLIEAILPRLKWLRDNDAQIPAAHVFRLKLVRLLRVLYTRNLPCTENDLRMMLDLTVPLLNDIAPDGPVDYVMEYIRHDDLTPELCQSLHQFQDNLVEVGSVASMQSLRQRLHTLLWMDEWEPLNPTRCWSEAIRRDLRAMTGERRVRWRHLLKHIRGNAPQRMPASWANEAAQLLSAVGSDDFCDQLALWFAPFRSGQPLRLSIAGSHILKGLIWYAAVSGDARARDSSLGLLDAKWKQKRNAPKSLVALEVFGISKEELLSRGLISEVKSPPSRILERVLEIFRAPNANTHIVVDGDEDLIIVQGQLHFYRLFRATGRIERVTDKATLELNWPAIPDDFRFHLKQNNNSDEQLGLRATMLMYDALFPNYFKVI